MTQHLKSLLLKRQKSCHENGIKSGQFKVYRNAVNRARKSCKAVFYETKVQSMKEENPKGWWTEVKRLSCARAHSGALCNHIHAVGAEELSPQELANAINEAFLEPMEEYRLPRPLAQLPLEEDSAHYKGVSELRIARLLAKLNPSKACERMMYLIGYCGSTLNFSLTLYVV